LEAGPCSRHPIDLEGILASTASAGRQGEAGQGGQADARGSPYRAGGTLLLRHFHDLTLVFELPTL
ncbi:MAG TPA: hypothetical protein VFH49_10695, partial [Aquabacterium sp.]|nr:hypothetical protein [Aquabacterium sp.]